MEACCRLLFNSCMDALSVGLNLSVRRAQATAARPPELSSRYTSAPDFSFGLANPGHLPAVLRILNHVDKFRRPVSRGRWFRHFETIDHVFGRENSFHREGVMWWQSTIDSLVKVVTWRVRDLAKHGPLGSWLTSALCVERAIHHEGQDLRFKAVKVVFTRHDHKVFCNVPTADKLDVRQAGGQGERVKRAHRTSWPTGNWPVAAERWKVDRSTAFPKCSMTRAKHKTQCLELTLVISCSAAELGRKLQRPTCKEKEINLMMECKAAKVTARHFLKNATIVIMVDHQPVAARGQYARVAFPLVLVALCWLYPGRRHSDEGLLSRDLGSTFMNLNGDGDTSSKLCPQAKFRTPLFPSRSTSMTSGDSSLPPGFPQKLQKKNALVVEGIGKEGCSKRSSSSSTRGGANARISKAGPIRERKIPLRLSDLQEIKRAKALNMSQSNPRRGAEEGGKADNVGEDEGDDETLISSDDDRGRIDIQWPFNKVLTHTDNTDKNTKNSQQQQADKVGNTRPTSSLFPSSHSSTDASEDDNDDEEEKEEEDSKERGRRRRRKKNNDIDGRDDSSMSSDHRGQQRDHSRDAKRHRHHYRRRRRRHSSHHYTSRDEGGVGIEQEGEQEEEAIESMEGKTMKTTILEAEAAVDQAEEEGETEGEKPTFTAMRGVGTILPVVGEQTAAVWGLFSEAEVVVSSSPPLPASAAAAGALPPSVDAADDSLNHNQQHQEEEDLQSRGQRRGASASPLSTTTTRTVYTNRHFSKINAAKGTSAENMEEVWNRVLGAQTFKRPKAGDSVYLSWTESTGSSLQQQQQQQ
eukprot:jgi/Bigna1/89117/estExt_fgenesh1_pg.C_440032